MLFFLFKTINIFKTIKIDDSIAKDYLSEIFDIFNYFALIFIILKEIFDLNLLRRYSKLFGHFERNLTAFEKNHRFHHFPIGQLNVSKAANKSLIFLNWYSVTALIIW